MTTNISTIETYQGVDLTPFEARSPKPGVGNARTTGPVYVGGVYIPYGNKLSGTGFFDGTDSSTVTHFVFDPSWNTLNAQILNLNDSVTIDTTVLPVTSIIDATSFRIGGVGFDGTVAIALTLGQREYLVEPDFANTSYGDASFTLASTLVTGVGTSWLSQLSTGDFIKHDGFQQTYAISHVNSNTQIVLTEMYMNDSTFGSYTASRVAIGSSQIQYVKDDFSYDNQTGKWKYDTTTGSDFTTSSAMHSFVDGLQLAFTPAPNNEIPGLMMNASVYRKTFARQTQYDVDQFPFPVVPSPEESVEVLVNGVKINRFPSSKSGYVLSYSPNPIWEQSPPPAQRKVCSIMFLDQYPKTKIPQSITEEGYVQFLDSSKNAITGIMPGSVNVWLDGTTQTPNKNYILDNNTGLADVIDWNTDEQIVKYISVDQGSLVNYGFEAFLNGRRLQVSYPPKQDDDIIFQPRSGKFKPRTQSKPGPGEVYEFRYQVDGAIVSDQIVQVVPGSSMFRVKSWPIKRHSVFLKRNNVILTEVDDYRISYQTGIVTLTSPMVSSDAIVITYTPLSKQANEMTYDASSWWCTTMDARLKVVDASTFRFSVYNPAVDLGDASTSVLRIYNESRSKDYSLEGASKDKQAITLSLDTINTAVGLSPSDTVLIDYKVPRPILEYVPVTYNNWVISKGQSLFVIEGVDVSSLFPPGTIVQLGQPDSAKQFYYFVESTVYTAAGTEVTLNTGGVGFTEEIVNPLLGVTDRSVVFTQLPLPMNAIMAGSTEVYFTGRNIKNLFRKGTLLKIGTLLYSVEGAVYDSGTSDPAKQHPAWTAVQLNSALLVDVTAPITLSSVSCSDCPVYAEGTTEIVPFEPISAAGTPPSLILCQKGFATLPISVSDTAVTVDSSVFLKSDSTTIGQMATDIATKFYPNILTHTDATDWMSSKILPLKNTQYIYTDSSVVLGSASALRVDGSDSTSFSVTPSGTVLLKSGLVAGQRIALDYMGRRFLSDSTVHASCDFFTRLPKKSKIQASFQYGNLDQFYIQVLSERQFLDDVTIPRMNEEAKQLAGNAGQGGEIPGDENAGNSEGGIVDNVYRLTDLQIECRVFKRIYDFFDGRINAYGNEILAANGLKMFNNDGPFTQSQQDYATASFSRIFPNGDWAGMSPERVNPLTGEFVSNGAFFTNGSTSVFSTGSSWTKQLPINPDSTCFIGRFRSQKRYRIAQVVNDSSISLLTPFTETSTADALNGEAYTASATYPAYDDDGYMGAKIVGTKSSNFNLGDGVTHIDDFEWYVNIGQSDSSRGYVKFDVPVGLLAIIPPPAIFAYYPTNFDAARIAAVLSSTPGVSATVESIIVAPGSRPVSVLVLRTVSPYNTLTITNGSAVQKLGFAVNTQTIGNLDRVDNAPESYELWQEGRNLGPVSDMTSNEHDDLGVLGASGIPNKFGRINLPVLADFHNHVVNEANAVAIQVTRLISEIAATSVIMLEPTLPAYNDATLAHDYATNFLGYPYSSTYSWPTQQTAWYDGWLANWQDKTTGWLWVLNWTDRTQVVNAKDAFGVAVDTTGVVPIRGQSTFTLQVPVGNDIRITNWTVDQTNSIGYSDPPHVTYNDGTAVDGVWTGWDPLAANKHSVNNQAFFTLNNSAPLFVMQMDRTRPNPSYTTTSSVIHFNWMEDEGARSVDHTYSSYPTVSSLMAAIDATQGFGTFVANGALLGYDYTNLRIQTIPSIGGAPGAMVYAGTASPALGMNYRRDFSLSTTSLTCGDTVFPFSTYPTLGALVSATGALDVFSSTLSFAPEYPSTNLIPFSGDATNVSFLFDADVAPFGIKFTPTDASITNGSYSTSPSKITLTYTDGTIVKNVDKSFSFYSTLAFMRSTISSEPQFDATLFYNASSYSYQALIGGQALNTGSYTPVTMQQHNVAMTLNATAPTWKMDSTALKLSFPSGSPREYLYTSYPTLFALSTAIGVGTDMDSTLFYGDTGYAFGNLETNNGTVSTTQTVLHFGTATPAPLFKVYWDATSFQYSTDTTSLNLYWMQDTTSKSQRIGYSDHTSVGNVRAAVDLFPGLDTTSDSILNLNKKSEAFKIASGAILYDASIYEGLRPCRVDFHSISDKLLSDRTTFILQDRSSTLQPRRTYLDSVREPQIRHYLDGEQLLHASDGNIGDLWVWANNRWNRRQGSEARRVAMERQISTNQSAAAVNKTFQ